MLVEITKIIRVEFHQVLFIQEVEVVAFLASILQVVFLLLFPPGRGELAVVVVVVEMLDGGNGVFALLGIEGTVELELGVLLLDEFEGLGAPKGALIFIIFDAVHALEAEIVLAGAVAGVGLLSDVVADGALVLLCFLGRLNEVFGLEGFHT